MKTGIEFIFQLRKEEKNFWKMYRKKTSQIYKVLSFSSSHCLALNFTVEFHGRLTVKENKKFV